jgi:hypothetical protein
MSCSKKDATSYQTLLTRTIGSLVVALRSTGKKIFHTIAVLLFHIIQGVLKRALQIWKRIEIYTEDIHNVLNCQNVAKQTEFYLG